MSDTYTVNGMTCGGCAKSVTNAFNESTPGANASVDIEAKTVTVEGVDAEKVKQVIEDAGFEFVGRA